MEKTQIRFFEKAANDGFKGLGEKLCRATIEKSKELGAKYSYLQVMQEKKPH